MQQSLPGHREPTSPRAPRVPLLDSSRLTGNALIRTALPGALIAAVVYFCFFSHLSALGLVGPDEPRYAAVAREMAESSDWVTPRLHGQPWFEKPILYYWAAGTAFRLLGVSEFSARLPSALAATLAALALGWAARRFYGPTTAWAVLLIFPTTVGVFAFARAATTDMLFSALLALAMVAASQSLFGSPVQPSRRLGLVAFGSFLGFAALAKGPAAVVLAGGSMAVWALLTRRWKDAFRLMHPLAAFPFLVVALPWYVVCALRNPEFVETFLISHNIERYLAPIFRHTQPVWFYGPVLALGLVPWTVLLYLAVRDGVRVWLRKRLSDSVGFFFASWAIFPVLLFSFSESKLPGYVLPTIPPLSLLLARSITQAFEEHGRSPQWALVGAGATYVALSLSLGHWLNRLPEESAPLLQGRILLWGGVTAAMGLLVATLGIWGRLRAAFVLAALVTAVLVEGIHLRVLPQLDAYLSPRTAASIALREQRDAATIEVYRLRRTWHYGLNFYLGRALPEWTPEAKSGLVFTNAAGAEELRRRGVKFRLLRYVSREAVLLRVDREANSGPSAP